MKFDLIVLGGGSGGIASAVRAAKHGASVAIIEKNALGGTCVNLGCVPKKVMFNAAIIAENFRKSSAYGFSTKNIELDWSVLVKNREEYIKRLRAHYSARLANLNIQHLHGKGIFIDKNTLNVNGKHYQAPHIIIATGGEPALPSDLIGIEHAITSDGFFSLTHQPKKIAIIGSGYISVELAGVLHGLGSETHLLARGEKLLSHFDPLLGDTLLEIMDKQGLHTHLNYHIESIIKHSDNKKNIHCQDGSTIDDLDEVIIAIGRAPRTSNLNLEQIGIQKNKYGFINVDEFQNTTIPGIYAIGDATPAPALTPVAIAAGRKLSDRLFAGQTTAPLDYDVICSAIFSHPPIGSVGLSENDAIKKFGIDHIKTYQTRFNPMLDALSDDKTPTVMKLVTLGSDEKIVGLHIIGYNADEILQGFGVAIKMGACKRDFDNTIAIHPTSAEELVTMV